jgi:hypothetical protein
VLRETLNELVEVERLRPLGAVILAGDRPK